MQIDESDEDAIAIRSWVDSIVAHEGSNVSQIAESRGLSSSTLTRFMRGATKALRADALNKLATNSPVPVPLQVQKKLDLLSPSRREQDVNINKPLSSDKIPVWGVHPVHQDGEFRLNAIPVYFLDHTASTSKSLKLAAFYAPDETMAPRWHAGEPVIFDRARGAAPGDYAMIRLMALKEAPNEDETWLFRRLEKRSDGKLFVSALDQHIKATTIPVERVMEIRRVLNWSDLLG